MHDGTDAGPQERPTDAVGQPPEEARDDQREHGHGGRHRRSNGTRGTDRVDDGDAVDPGDVPTTILDLRTAFAQAGAVDSPPLGIVVVEREHPMRAAAAFLAVLVVIGLAAGGIVVGAASAGRTLYDKVAGPPKCTQAQVAEGAALEAWMRTTARSALGKAAKVTRTGCVTVDVLDPQKGQSAVVTTKAGASSTKMVAALKKRGCTLGKAGAAGIRTCNVYVGDRLAAVELRPDPKRRTNAFGLAYK